jgi:hypothetical protein
LFWEENVSGLNKAGFVSLYMYWIIKDVHKLTHSIKNNNIAALEGLSINHRLTLKIASQTELKPGKHYQALDKIKYCMILQLLRTYFCNSYTQHVYFFQ